MSGCLLIGAAVYALAAPEFTLSWTHSIERTEWRESWVARSASLRLTRVAIKGSGAGMEPGEDARVEDGWLVWSSDVDLPRLILAASGATGEGWQLCSGGLCREIGSTASAPLVLKPCGG